MASVPQLLEQIIASCRLLSNENRGITVKQTILPAILALRDCSTQGAAPPLVTVRLDSMESWALYIATNPTSWQGYADRLIAQAKSLRILAQVQTMGEIRESA